MGGSSHTTLVLDLVPHHPQPWTPRTENIHKVESRKGADQCPVHLPFPFRFWKLDPGQVYASGPNAWDTAVHDASEEYKHRMHNLCCDNCHSHVALALNLMRYNNSTNWNMVTLCFFCLIYGKYVSVGAFVKTWLPFVLLLGIILTISLVFNLR